MFLKENLEQFYLPDNSQVLAKAVELTINSSPWLKDRGDSRDVHKYITPDLAFKLGAKTLLDKRIGKYSKTMGTPFGQHEELTDRLKTIFTSYPCDSGILKELVQNADDSQATEIHFIYDKRTLPCKKVFQNDANEIQGPALCVYNNRSFSEKDFEGIQKLGIGSKSGNAEQTGQFGVGFNAVYHLTDCPSFLSNGETLCVLDPHFRYAPSATYEYPGERFDPIDQEFQDDFPDVMDSYLGEFGFDLRGSTMFRLPLRTVERSQHSEISTVVGEKQISSLLVEFESEAKRSMLFLNHIRKISISKIDNSGQLVKEYEVASNVDKEDMEKLGTLFLHKQEFKEVPTKKIPWKGVTFPLVLSDTKKCVEQWLVHQCHGVKFDDTSEEIPDGRPNKLLPHGGLAALVSSNQRYTSSQTPRYFAYCFLPLPVRTSLPVHVNGHFAIDPGRRGLWEDVESKHHLTLWNNMVKKNVLAPGYAALILEARKYMPFCEREGEDKTSCYFPGKSSAEAGLFWYHNLFPKEDESWSALTLAVYAFLKNNKNPVLPVVVEDEPKSNERSEDMPRRIRKWFPVQEVFFVDKYRIPPVADELMKILLDIHFPVVKYSLMSIRKGFEKAGYTPRVLAPESVVVTLRNYCSTDAECKIGILPCDIEATTISNKRKLRELITYCRKGEKFPGSLPGLPLLLTADSALRVFSEDEKVFCSEFSDLFSKQAEKFVHPEIVSSISRFMQMNNVPEETSIEPLSDATNIRTFPTVMLPLTTHVVATFMSDVYPDHTKGAKTHLDLEATGVSEEWLKRLWMYLQTYSKNVDDTEHPLDALDVWPIVPTTSKKLVTVQMAKTVFDMTLVGNESYAAKNVRGSLKKLNCPCLDTSITLPEQKSQTWTDTFVSRIPFLSSASKVQSSEAVTKLHVSHPHNVSDVLNVFDFMLKIESLDAKVLSDEEITAILKFIQDGFQDLNEKEKYREILKKLPFYKAINGKHYKLSDFLEYAVIPADVPTEEIDTLQVNTQCLFLHSDMLPALEKLLTELDAGAKRSAADFYVNYILPNFLIFSDEMQLRHLTHIRDRVFPTLLEEGARSSFLNHLRRTRCIPDRTGKHVHASDFYDPRHEVFRVMEEESSRKFPPPLFNDTKWLDFLVLFGMLENVDETLFMRFASRVAKEGKSCSNETARVRSKTLLSFFVRNHHLHSPSFLLNISTVKFIASENVQEAYLSLHKQHCCDESSDNPPFVQFSNSVSWKYRRLVWTSACLLPAWCVFSNCTQDSQCNTTESLYKHLQVTYPSPDMVLSHLQNISGDLAEYSKKEQALPQRTKLTTIMNCIYEFLQEATKCSDSKTISAGCSNVCKTIGIRLENTSCILVDDSKFVVKGNQLSFKIPGSKSLVPFIYQVPREYGKLEHLLKRLGATETITPLQLVDVFKKMKDRTKNNRLDPHFEKKAHDAMFLLFDSVLNEAKEENKQSSIANVQELYLPSEDKKLIKSSDLLCKIPSRHIKTIARLPYHALCFFETCGLQRELENKYFESLPAKLRPKPFHDVAEEKLDESCLEKTCKACSNGTDCEFVEKLKVLLKSKEFKNGIIRLLKHQKESSNLSQEEEEVTSRLFENKVEIKCMEKVQVHLIVAKTNEVLEGSSTSRKSYVVKLPHDAWTLYMEHDKMHGSLAKSINKILDWKIKDEFLLAVSGMLNSSQPYEIPEVLNDYDIEVDAGRNEEVELGSEVPIVFHQLLQQNPLFIFHIGERVAFCAQLPDDDESSPIKYILAEILKCVTSNSVDGAYDFEARYLIDIGNESREVSVLDLYKFYADYPDENSCKDLVPFTGNVSEKPKSYDEAKREILEALRAARRLPPEQRRKLIRRLYLRWHPDKNPDNIEFATTMMAFLLEEVKRMEKEEEEIAENPPNFDDMFKECNRRAARDSATYQNYRSQSTFHTESTSSSSPSFPFSYDSGMFDRAAVYTTPNPEEAKRWIQQAEGDFRVCQCLLTARTPFHAAACFTSQQIVEKSLKAALYAECGLTHDQLHTHDVYSLARNVQDLRRWQREKKTIEIVDLALVVSNYYLPTRYPNRQPFPTVPFDAFNDKSDDAMLTAAQILRHVKEFTGR